jgi:hypothetical protein
MSATAPSTATRAPAAVLTMNDRCDRCGAQAYLHVELASGGALLFCGHHAREYGPQLRRLAVAVYDETASLTR